MQMMLRGFISLMFSSVLCSDVLLTRIGDVTSDASATIYQTTSLNIPEENDLCFV
jgi:hypothetical protein